jgi:cytochrome P450/NADPH-cytochrome P450 reductase
LEKRKENPVEGKDLLNLMLNGKDPKTGQGMTEESIVDNVSKQLPVFGLN